MAISRDKKQTVVGELTEQLNEAKLATFAHYEGLSVAELQDLRRQARDTNVRITVVKNRLFKVALQQTNKLKNAPTDLLKGQLLYALSAEDEIAPAQLLAQFGKTHEALKLAGGINGDGDVFGEADIKALASLPSKQQLRGQLVGTIAAPLSGFANVLAGNVRGLLYALNARAENTAK